MMKKANVLIVDDSRSALFAVRALLSPAGIHTVTASDAFQGQEALRTGQFDLVITDVDMPNMSGLEFCEWIKSNPETAHVPVIVLAPLIRTLILKMVLRSVLMHMCPNVWQIKELIPRIESVMNRCTFVKDKPYLWLKITKPFRW